MYHTFQEGITSGIVMLQNLQVISDWLSQHTEFTYSDCNTQALTQYLTTNNIAVSPENLNRAVEALGTQIQRTKIVHRDNLNFVKLPSIGETRDGDRERAEAAQQRKAAEEAAKQAAAELAAREAAEKVTLFRNNGTIDFSATERARKEARERNGKSVTVLNANSSPEDMKKASPAELKRFLTRSRHGDLRN